MAGSFDDDSRSSASDESDEEIEVLGDRPLESPDIFEDFFEPNDDHWLSEDHLYELQMAKDPAMKAPPSLSTWKEGEPTAEVEVTVGKARRIVWEQGKAEINLHRNNVSLLPVTGSSAIDKVYQYMYGTKSKLCQLFKDKLNISTPEYLQFLITYFKSCCYKMTVSVLHDCDDSILLLMPTESYNQIWRSIATLHRHAHGESFWQEVESLFNSIYVALFMEAENDQSVDESMSNFRYLIGLDDDKCHYNYTKKTKTDGLKKDHHAKDNRHGFTAHTACHSATAAPLNVSFQRTNETVRLTTERMIDTLFGQHTGKANKLDNVELAMDRGYWEAVLLFRLLDQGANIHGTIKRMDWVPLTFDHKGNSFPAQPFDIPKQGFKDSFYMHTKWKGKKSAFRKLACVGYRSGTGTAVSIAMLSHYRKVHWDLVPYGNIRWYHDKDLSVFDKKSKSLALLAGNDPDNNCRKLLLDAMEPRTCQQGTADWFIDRQLSGTSSTVAELVLAVAPLIGNDDGEDIVDAFRTVLDYAGYDEEILGSAIQVDAEDNEIDKEKNKSDSDDTDDDEEDERKVGARSWFSTLIDENVDMDDEFKAEAKSMDKVVLSWIVAFFKKKDYKLLSAAAAKKQIDLVLSSPKACCPYTLLTMPELKKLADKKNIKTTGLKKEALIAELVKPEGKATPANTANKKQQRTKKEDVDPSLLPLYTLFKQSFLRQQAKGPREAAAIGHRNEEPFLKSFYDLCTKSRNEGINSNSDNQYSFSTLDPVAIFRLGLMQKKDNRFAKASLDAATIIKTELDELVLLPTEVKSRVSTTTMNEARDRVADLVGAEQYDPRAKYLINVPSNDPLLRLLIHDEGNPNRKKSECFQLLHSAFVAGSTEGLLLVGMKDALSHAVRVSYQPSLLVAYSTVINFIYNKYAKPFYECSVEELQANKAIPQVLEYINYMDTHSFWTTYMLWRSLNVDVNPSNIWFPLPPIARCIPMQNAMWNLFKPPSDTTTKVVDSMEEQLGVRTPRTIATSRLLSVGSVAFHRSNQMLSSKDPEQYATLFDYRHAANTRFSMAGSLSVLLKFLADDFGTATEAAPRVLFAATLVPPNTPPRRTRAAEEAPQRVSWSYYGKTGNTPMRGRPANVLHKLREKKCDGRVLVAMVADPTKDKDAVRDVRQKCRLCGTKTNHYCTGCKNYLCFGVTQGMTDKRAEAIVAKDADDCIERPKATIKMTSFDPKKDAWIPSFAKNCCYLVHHRDAFDDLWTEKHAKEGEEDGDSDDKSQQDS